MFKGGDGALSAMQFPSNRHPGTRTSCVAAAVLAAVLLVVVLVPSAPATPADRVLTPRGGDLAAIQETMRLPAATWLNDRDGDKVFDSLEAEYDATDADALSVVVTFRHGVSYDRGVSDVQAAVGDLEVRYAYPNLGGLNAVLTLDEAVRVAGLDVVRQVEWDQPGRIELDTATESFGVRSVQDHLGLTGDGDDRPAHFSDADVAIAILDTGFHGGHIDLAGKFRVFYDAEDQSAKEPYDSGTHGTHVASIAGGLGLGDPAYTGVAPGAAFVGFKISGGQAYDGQSEGSKAGALWAYDKILEIKDEYNIRVATISFGFGTTVDGTDALELAVDKLWAAGVVAVKSTGNSGPERGTVTVPGGARGIISVANMVDPGPSESTTTASWIGAGDVQVPDYGFHLRTSSSRGPTEDGRVKPDIAAPGSSIMAADADSDDGYVPKTGTSMAAPFTAGVAALIFDADPGLTPDQVRGILFNTTDDWGVPGPDIEYGHGRLNALAAVQTALIDRLVRDRAPYEEIQLVAGAPAPDVPWRDGGILTGTGPHEKTFDVEDAGKPLALTVIHNRSYVSEEVELPAPVGATAINAPRVSVVEVLGPDDGLVGKIESSPLDRHRTLFFMPEAAGTYTLRAFNVDGTELVWDVSAGLPAPDGDLPVVVVPEADAYAGLLADGADDGQAPGAGVLVALAAVAAALLVAVRRNPR